MNWYLLFGCTVGNQAFDPSQSHYWLVVWNMILVNFQILGIIIPIDFHIFQRGWNHQPDRDKPKRLDMSSMIYYLYSVKWCKIGHLEVVSLAFLVLACESRRLTTRIISLLIVPYLVRDYLSGIFTPSINLCRKGPASYKLLCAIWLFNIAMV